MSRHVGLLGVLLWLGCGSSSETQQASTRNGTATGAGGAAADSLEASTDGALPMLAVDAAGDVSQGTEPDGRGESSTDERDAADATSSNADEPPDAVDAPEDTGPESVDAVPACTDRLKNGDETDVDCGGSCAPCGPNKRCLVDSDCSATAAGCDMTHGGCKCDATSLRCVYSHCFDRKIDDGETDVDCASADCKLCDLGKRCQADDDCTSHACDAVSFTCISSACSDHRQDGTESDVDCGGPNICPRCQVGRKCNINGDCQLGHTCSMGPSSVCQ